MEATNNDSIILSLTKQEALVFYDWLARFNDNSQRTFDDQSEERVLFDLEAVLEKTLAEPLAKDYGTLLAKARASVRDPVE